MEAPPQKRRAGGRVLETKTYRPTLAEFRDPYVYIASIRAEGERYGIVRAVRCDVLVAASFTTCS